MLPNFISIRVILTDYNLTAVFAKKDLSVSITTRIHAETTKTTKPPRTEIVFGFTSYMKTKKCEWEGCEIDDPDMLVLDHLNPAEKRIEISRMVQCSYGLESVKLEVSKCRVLCANHHQKYTIQQFGYKKWQPKE